MQQAYDESSQPAQGETPDNLGSLIRSFFSYDSGPRNRPEWKMGAEAINRLRAQLTAAKAQLEESRKQFETATGNDLVLIAELKQQLTATRRELEEAKGYKAQIASLEMLNSVMGQNYEVELAQLRKELDEANAGNWYSDGLKIALKLVSAGIVTDGIVDGVTVLISDHDQWKALAVELGKKAKAFVELVESHIEEWEENGAPSAFEENSEALMLETKAPLAKLEQMGGGL